MKKDNAEPAESGSEEEQNLGLLLQSARDSSGASLEEIAAELRIEPHLLRALEECRFEALGAPVFAKGYLKQYGARLGLDYKNLLSEYYRLVDTNDVDITPQRAIKLRDERQITIWMLAALAIALLAVFLLIWWLSEPAGSADIESSSVAEQPVQSAATPPATENALRLGANDLPATANVTQSAAGIGARPLDAADSGGATSPVATIAEAGFDSLVADEGVAEASSNVPADPQPTGLAQSTSVTASAAPLVVANDETVTVELRFTADCWTEVTDARGDRLFFGLGEAGAQARFEGMAPIDFVLGNANGVTVAINNGTYAIPTSARRGTIARFTVASATN